MKTVTFDTTQEWGFNDESARVIRAWGSGCIPKISGTKNDAVVFSKKHGFTLRECKNEYVFEI